MISAFKTIMNSNFIKRNKYPLIFGIATGVGITAALARSSGTESLDGFLPELTRSEAELILDLPSNWDENDLKKRYRILMALNHPDKGGSSYLASKINDSFDLLSFRLKK